MWEKQGQCLKMGPNHFLLHPSRINIHNYCQITSAIHYLQSSSCIIYAVRKHCYMKKLRLQDTISFYLEMETKPAADTSEIFRMTIDTVILYIIIVFLVSYY
jgi:hypothetical protein